MCQIKLSKCEIQAATEKRDFTGWFTEISDEDLHDGNSGGQHLIA